MQQTRADHFSWDRTGSVKNRAQVLHKSLEDTPDLLNRDVNFVAHSMVSSSLLR